VRLSLFVGLGLAVTALPAAAPKRQPPDVESPPGKTCIDADCHGNYLGRTVLHGPVARGKCDACHRYAGRKHEFEYSVPLESLCTSCHLTRWWPFNHEPYAKGECHRCHDPHGSEHRMLVRSNPAKEHCLECHEPAKILPGPHRHGPAGVGACIVCHEVHGSWHEKLLVQEGKELCRMCHDDTIRQTAAFRHIHEPIEEGKECTACHDSHSSLSPALLKAGTEKACLDCHEKERDRWEGAKYRHGALNSSEGCLDCHAGHGSNISKLLVAGELELCLRCHDQEIVSYDAGKLTDMARLFRQNPVLHGPVARGQCSACHEPHVSSSARLLVEPYPPEFYAPFSEDRYKLCFHCHLRELAVEPETALTRFRDGERNLHFVHVNKPDRGRSCRVCHEVHASRRPFHMREWVPFGPREWKLEIGHAPNEDGGSCAPGCHATKQYRWSPAASPGGSP